jgi:hypothetical protein
MFETIVSIAHTSDHNLPLLCLCLRRFFIFHKFMVGTKYAYFADEIIDDLHTRVFTSEELSSMELSAWKSLPDEVCLREAEAAGLFLGYNLNQLKLKIKTTACSLSTFLGDQHDIPEERCRVTGMLELPAANFLARLVRELPRKNALWWLEWVIRITAVVFCATPFFTRMAYGASGRNVPRIWFRMPCMWLVSHCYYLGESCAALYA